MTKKLIMANKIMKKPKHKTDDKQQPASPLGINTAIRVKRLQGTFRKKNIQTPAPSTPSMINTVQI